MIKRFNRYCLGAMLLLAAALSARAQDGGQAVTLRKTESKSFTVSPKVKLVLNNNFGNVKITTWKRKIILVKARISSTTKDAAQAADQLKRIHAEFEQNKDSISCTALVKSDITVTGKDPAHPDDTSAKREPISIIILPAKWCVVDFEVYVPATQPLSIHNGFGNIAMGDYAGRLHIDEKFGNLTAGYLTGSAQIEMSQGNVSIGHLRSGQINVKTFDHVTIGGISGAMNASFQFGRLLNLNLRPVSRTDSIGLKANNVQEVNISGITPIRARYSVKLAFAKLQFNGAAFTADKYMLSFREINVDQRKREAEKLDDSILRAHPELKIQSRDLTLSLDTLKQKKVKELTILSLAKFKKLHEYVAGPGNAKARVNIAVDFGTLNLMP